MKTRSTWRHSLVATFLVSSLLLAQEKSVNPGINKSFERPNVADFVERFEKEGREIYDRRKEIVEACQIKPGMAVADIGAGTGLFTRLFSPLVGPKGRVYAVDIAEEFVKHVERASREQGLANVVGIVCTADSAKLPPASIDLAFICDTYHHFEFPQKTMRSIRQALKPGGRVVLIDFRRIEGVSSEWVLSHVRAGQDVFTKEIVDSGFRQIEEQKDLLKDNYFVRFESVEEQSATITRVWLSHRTNNPSKIVVNWTSKEPGESVVRYGLTKDYGQQVRDSKNTTLHHVEIPLAERNAVYHYSVSTGQESSPDATFKANPTDEFRVAAVANWHGRPDPSSILKDDVHLLLTAGDNIPSLWQKCGAGNKDCITPFAELIDAYPELFRSTPFMPVLGNHDREIRPRGDKPPSEPVYDIDATAFRRFFELPDDEWKWHFDVPDFSVRFVALDFNHIQDRGTTWQTCHDYKTESEQFRWYEKLMANPPPGFVVTVYNERNASMRGQEKGAWHDLFRNGTACITGFGHFAERAEVDGRLYFNTSLQGRGAKYPDPASKVLVSEDNYILMTFRKASKTMTVELKDLKGEVQDRVEVN